MRGGADCIPPPAAVSAYITNLDITHAAKVTALRSRDAWYVDKSDLAHLNQATQLTELSLHYSDLDDGAAEELTVFSSELEIDVSNISALKNLKVLRLVNTNLRPGGPSTLRRTLPRCQLIVDAT